MKMEQTDMSLAFLFASYIISRLNFTYMGHS